MLELAHFKQGTEADDYIKEVMTNQQAPAPAPAPAGTHKSSSAWTGAARTGVGCAAGAHPYSDCHRQSCRVMEPTWLQHA